MKNCRKRRKGGTQRKGKRKEIILASSLIIKDNQPFECSSGWIKSFDGWCTMGTNCQTVDNVLGGVRWPLLFNDRRLPQSVLHYLELSFCTLFPRFVHRSSPPIPFSRYIHMHNDNESRFQKTTKNDKEALYTNTTDFNEPNQYQQVHIAGRAK